MKSRSADPGRETRSFLREAFDAHYVELRAFAYRRTSSAAVAEDLVQEAFLRLIGLGPTAVENPRALLYRILGNLVIDRGRRLAREGKRAADMSEASAMVAEDPGAERTLIARERLTRLMEAVDRLPPRCRECFVLRRFEDLDVDEIARRMGISRNMVEKHLRHAVTECALSLRKAGA